MLGFSKVNMKVLDDSMKTMGSSKCRELLRVDRVDNRILAAIQSRTRFFSAKINKKLSTHLPS